MELHTLQVFATVVAERSFSRAAEKLYRTQPAVSLAVQRLETELGDKLIERDRRGGPSTTTRAGSPTSPTSSRTRSPSCAICRRGGW